MVSHALINKTHAEPIIPIENSSKDHALRAFAFFLKKILTKSKYTMDFKIGHFPGAKNTPLKKIDKYINELRKNAPLYIYCKGGYRSVIASSIISKENDLKLINIEGGYDEIEKLNFST